MIQTEEDAGRPMLGIVAHEGLRDSRTAALWRLAVGKGVGGRVAATGTPTLIRDYRHDPRRQSQVKSVVDAEGMRSGVVAALADETGDRPPVGVLYVGDRVPRGYEEADVELVGAYAAVAFRALERGRQLQRLGSQCREERAVTALIGLFGERVIDGGLQAGVHLLAKHFVAEVSVCDRHGHTLASACARAGAPGASVVVDLPLASSSTVLGSLRVRAAEPISLAEGSLVSLAAILTMELLRSQERYRTEMRLHTDLLDDVLEHRGDPGRLLDRAALLGLDLSTARTVVCIGAYTGTGAGRSRTPALTPRLLEAARSALDPMGSQTVVTLHDGNLVLLVPAAHELRSVPNGLVGRVSDVLGQVSTKVGGMQLAAGVGRRCTAVRDYAMSYNDSLLALELARAGAQGGAVVCHDQLGVYGLLAESIDASVLRATATRVLRPLLECDAGRRTTYLHTLSAWLANDRHLSRTAQTLHIHVNGLRYRLSRIAELLEVDFQDVDARFELELALRIQAAVGEGKQQ